jgi:hypothetical protein
MQQLFNVCPNLFMLHKLAALSRGDSPLDALPETSRFFDQAQSGVFHQMLSIGTSLGGDLRELCFLLWSKTYFHAPRLWILLSCVNLRTSLLRASASRAVKISLFHIAGGIVLGSSLNGAR